MCGRIHGFSRKVGWPRARVVHPKMTVNSLINFESKEWDARLLEQYVDEEDIPMIQSLAISPTHRHDIFCWSYTKNGQYTVKSGYRVATNILTDDDEKQVIEPSITKLQAFALKVNAPQKICHLIWQLISRQVPAQGIWYAAICDVITTTQDVESQKKLLLIPTGLTRMGYHQNRQALKLSLSRVSTPIWTIVFEGRIVL